MRLEPAAAETILCIYCKQSKPRPKPKQGEHIVQRGLGGSTCIQCVCGDCNSGLLQQLDEEFLRSSPVAYARVLLSKQGQLRSPGIVPSGLFNGWLDCVVRAPGAAAHVVPQVVIHNARLTTVISKPDQVGARKALLQLEQRGFDAVHVDVDARADNSPTRLVLLPKEKKNKYSFALRARTREDADKFLDAFRARGDGFGKVMAWTDVDLQLGTGIARISSDVNVPSRGAAKVAFNLFAYYFGADIALRREFDAVRSYIRGDDVLPVEDVTGPDGAVGFTMDQRFVGPWLERPPAKTWTALANGHTLVLTCERRVVRALLHLFSGAMTFAVQLGRLRPEVVFDRSLPFFFFTPTDGGGDEELTLNDVIMKVCPQALAPHEPGPYDGPVITGVE